MMAMKMKTKEMLLAVLILTAVFSRMDVVVEAGPEDCDDACSTACVQYEPNSRLVSRCNRKCAIRCGPDVAAEGNVG
ncbi:uncharacterized protein LOC104452749 [Eucalyptus grandis]|uniref:uncharacterized protein LOC104452749 n=1 Tax=Eucalyptus grandis TaxID=71139 RepID=UPI00192F0E7C|nr:uncharacterized protein LOC104452749 [Eucalyptus grandis]